MSDRDVAIATITAEHRALSAVLHTIQDLLATVEAGYGSPEFDLLAAALYYIDDFQERCHHPKEDAYLFKAVRAATSEFDAEIDALQAAHVSGVHAVARLHRCLVHYQGGAADGLAVFRASMDAYARQMADHIRREDELLARGASLVSEADWTRIAAAFDSNDDPLFGNNRRDEFTRLYQRIQRLAPRKLKRVARPLHSPARQY